MKKKGEKEKEPKNRKKTGKPKKNPKKPRASDLKNKGGLLIGK